MKVLVLLMNQCTMDGEVVNSRRANLKSLSVNDILFFNSVLKAEKEVLKFNLKTSHFYFTVTVFFKSFKINH